MLLLLRAHARAAAPACVRMGLPVVGGLGLVAGVFFGPNGMTARDALALMGASPLACAAGWAFWLLPSAPCAFAAFDPPGLVYLRALPLSRVRLWGAAAALLLLVEAPAAIFAARGGGPGAAVAALFVAAAAHAQAYAGLRGAADLAGVVALGGLLVARPAGWSAAALALPLAAWASFRAFRGAPERAAGGGRRRMPRRGLFALALALLLGVTRGAGLALARALALLVVGGPFAALVARNNAIDAPDELARLALGCAAPALTLALSTPVVALLATERSARELLDSVGVGVRRRIAASALAAAALGAAAGVCFAVPLLVAVRALTPGAAAHGSPVDAASLAARVGIAAIAAGAGLGALLVGTHRHALDVPGRTSHRLLVAVVAVAAAGGALGATIGEASVPAIALAALVALWASAPLAARSIEPVDAWGREGQ